MKHRRSQKIVLMLLISCFTFPLFAQQDTTDDDRTRFFALPLVFLTPETSWGFGGAGVLSFKMPEQGPENRPSQLQLGGAYTLNDQILLYLPFQLFFKEDHFNLYGELGYYRYNYFFYGIGNSYEDYDGELYDVTYPRLRLNALYKVAPNLYTGLRYWMDDFDITNVEKGGLLDSLTISGQEGDLLSGLGWVANYDTRDQVFFPTSGWLVETVYFYNGKSLGSPFDYQKWYLNGSKYLSWAEEQVLALQVYAEMSFGEVPFNQMALMGGTKLMRGYYEGRFRDKHMVLLQSEYRFPLFWRLGAVAFGGIGAVSPELEDLALNNLRYTLGLGLRLTIIKRDHINVRFDFGFGKNTSGFYITIGEAF